MSIDDLHRWYTAHAEIEENRSIELAQSSASSVQKIDETSVANNGGSSNDSGSTFDPAIENLSAQHLRDSAVETGNGKIDAKSDIQTKLGENESNDAFFSPKLPQDHVRMNSSSESGESSTSTSNSQGESQTEVKIGNQSNCDPESDNLKGGTGSNQASESPKPENSAEQHLRDSTVTETSSEEKRRIRCRELMAGLHPPHRKIRDFGSVSGPESTNCEFGPVSGPKLPQKTNSGEFTPKSGAESPKTGELAPENSISGPRSQSGSRRGDFGPVSEPKSTQSPQLDSKSPDWPTSGPVSGSEAAQNQDLGPNVGSESQNSTKLGDLGPVSGPKSHQTTEIGHLDPESTLSGQKPQKESPVFNHKLTKLIWPKSLSRKPTEFC